jgi:hypothetical protein
MVCRPKMTLFGEERARVLAPIETALKTLPAVGR